MSPKRIALWFLIASVGASALLGIIIVLAGTFSEIEVRIVITTLTISAMSICALAAGALWEKGQKKVLSMTGIVLAILAAFLILFGIWTKTNGEEFWKFSASVGLVAVATAHACLLALASLSRSFAWARVAAFVAVYALAIEIIYVIYQQPRGDTMARIIGATSIVVAALTIVTPVFHRLSRKESGPNESTEATQLAAQVSCPQCGSRQPNAPRQIQCENCGCRFVITILQAGSRPSQPAAS